MGATKKLILFSNRYLIVLLIGGVNAFADDVPNPNDIYLRTPTIEGSGCPLGSASAALSPDAKSLSILFDQFQVDAGGSTGKMIDRKTCDIAIPVHIPQGYSVSVTQLDYRGFNSLPQGAQSIFKIDYFFAGSRGPGFARGFYGPINENFIFSNQITGPSVIWSACGQDVSLRVNSAMQVQTGFTRAQATATVDSADAKASLQYQLQWKRCDAGANPHPILPQPTQPQPGDPGFYTGNCSIDADPRQGGFIIRDINQNLIGRAPRYEEAARLAKQADLDGRCLGSAIIPNPVPGKLSCQLNTPNGIFTGVGNSVGQATAAARGACLQKINNSFVCNRGSVRCL